MSERRIDVVAAGHICLDIIPGIPESAGKTIGEILRPGKLVNVDAAAISTGGPVSNTGIALALLGLRVAFMTQVGDDYFGQAVISRLQERGASDGVKVMPGEVTSYTVALAPPGIDRIFLHCPGTNNTFTSAAVNPEMVQHARLFHLGYPPLMRALYANDGEELMATFRLAKEAGATTSLDMSLPDPASESGQADWKTILRKTLPYLDIFLPSIEEAMFMLDRERFLTMKEAVGGAEIIDHLTGDDYTALADELLAYGPAIVALKSAHRGFYVKTGSAARLATMGPAAPANLEQWANREIWCPAYHVPKIASATGSGDSSIAGFLSALLNGLSIEEALQTANCVGSQNVRVLDALSGIHSWDETRAMVAALPTQNAFDPASPGWTWDEAWRGAVSVAHPNNNVQCRDVPDAALTHEGCCRLSERCAKGSYYFPYGLSRCLFEYNFPYRLLGQAIFISKPLDRRLLQIF